MEGGADTVGCPFLFYINGDKLCLQSASAVQSFFLAMAMYPEVQKKAQKELDAVVGCERLPDFSDRNALPYINAVVKETLRWQPVTPLGESSVDPTGSFDSFAIVAGVAHYSTRDDEYDGFFIPKGSIGENPAWFAFRDSCFYSVYLSDRKLLV
jgi:hypothetical protein